MQVRRAKLITVNLAWMGEFVLMPNGSTTKIQFVFVRIKKPKPAKCELAHQVASVKVEMEVEFAQRSAHSLLD